MAFFKLSGLCLLLGMNFRPRVRILFCSSVKFFDDKLVMYLLASRTFSVRLCTRLRCLFLLL